MRASRPRASTASIFAGFLLAFGYAMWLLSPRFGIPSPSAIDDWNGSTHGARSVGDLLLPFVDSPVQRFRPGFDLFDYVEWHTLGAPLDMTGPNLWNAVRIALLVAAIGAVPALVARASRSDLSPFALAALAAIPPAVVVTGTTIPVDLARLAPQEPMLVGATVCGAALVLLGLDRHVSGESLRRALTPTAFGWPLFVLGATFKEASMCFLAVAPFLYLFLARRWRERGLTDSLLSPLRSPAFFAWAAALVVPLLWVAFRSATVGDEGANLYQAGAPTGADEWGDRLRYAWNLQWAGMTGTVGSALWRGLAVALPLMAVAVALDRRRVPWLALGLGLAAAGMLVVQGLPAIVTSRYFLPTMALVAMATTLLLAQGRAWPRWAALAAGVVIVVGGAGTARQSVQAWAAGEKATSVFVAEMAEIVERGCPLHASGLDVERGEALPRLTALQVGRIGRRCPLRTGTLVATLAGADPSSVGNTGLWAVCDGTWSARATSGIWMLVSCAELRERVGADRVPDILRGARLIPGVGPIDRAACWAREPDGRACDRPALRREEMWP